MSTIDKSPVIRLRSTVNKSGVYTFTFVHPSDGSLFDPTTPLFQVKDPSGVVTTPTVTHVSTGIYQFSHTPTVPGQWHYSAASTTVGEADEQVIYLDVSPSDF
jgi:hypothetical protein